MQRQKGKLNSTLQGETRLQSSLEKAKKTAAFPSSFDKLIGNFVLRDRRKGGVQRGRVIAANQQHAFHI